MNKLVKFIKENKLSFEGMTGSALNSDCCVLSGFALHCGINDVDEVKRAIWDAKSNKKRNFVDELERVFQYAESNSYERPWKRGEFDKLYKF
jgi:hypothetical protein